MPHVKAATPTGPVLMKQHSLTRRRMEIPTIRMFMMAYRQPLS